MARMPIGEVFTWWARRDPDGAALRMGADVLTRAGLEDRSERLARHWVAEGLAHDDLVTVALPSSLDLVVACVAAWKAGAAPQPLSPTTPAAERERLLAVARPWRVVDRPLGETPDAPGFDPRPPASAWKVATSSGSTGTPKLIRAAASAVVDPEADTTSFLPAAVDAPQTQLVAGPLTHGAPFVYAMRGLMTGHSLVLMERFEPDEWLRLVAAHGVTWAMLVPTMMQRILRRPERPATDVDSLASVVHLGAACPPWLKRAWIDWLGPERITEVYAGTESQGVAVITGSEWLAHPGSVGRAQGDTTFRVVRDDGAEAAAEETGEVLMRRSTSASTYLGRESEEPDAWHSLGDLGHLDAEGYLYLAGRADDVITRGGTSILPAPVEAALEEHPQVRSALVVGVPDDELGEQVHAVVDDAGTGVTEDELRAWLEGRVGSGERPRTWRIVDEVLRDDAGKARRRDRRPPTA